MEFQKTIEYLGVRLDLTCTITIPIAIPIAIPPIDEVSTAAVMARGDAGKRAQGKIERAAQSAVEYVAVALQDEKAAKAAAKAASGAAGA